MTEQAYHARGAGREVNFEDWWKQFEPHSIRASLKEACRAAFIAALREPGADTGTTPEGLRGLSHKPDCKWATPLPTEGFWGCDCGLDKLLLELEAYETEPPNELDPLSLRSAAERGTTPSLINQKIPLDECLVEYRNNGSQLFMRFEDGTVLRFALAEPSLPPRAEAILKAILGKIHEWRMIGSDPEVLLESRNLHAELADEMEQAFDSAEPVAAAERGTTPPPLTAEFEPLLRGELKHGRSCPAVGAPMDEGNCDCGLKWRIRLQTEMTLRNAWEKRTYEAEAALAAAEGLTLYDILNTKAFNGSMHQAKQIADEINAKLAATQRAPVEQGRGATKVIADLRRALEQVRKEAGGKQDYALSNCYNIADTILRRAPWGDVTAPDHAREGALRAALKDIRLTPSMPFPDPNAHSWRVYGEALYRAYSRIQQIAHAALADGKEGGE